MDDLWDPVDPEDFLHHLHRQRTRLVGVDHGADDITGFSELPWLRWGSEVFWLLIRVRIAVGL